MKIVYGGDGDLSVTTNANTGSNTFREGIITCPDNSLCELSCIGEQRQGCYYEKYLKNTSKNKNTFFVFLFWMHIKNLLFR